MTSNACSKLLLVVMLLAALSGAIVPAAANDTPPSENPDIVDVLEVSKLQAPSSGDNIHDLIGYSSSNFFLQVDLLPPIAAYASSTVSNPVQLCCY